MVRSSVRLLLLCPAFDTPLQYRVLRCAAEAAEAIYVLGPESARRLASSRFCSGFIPAASLEGSSSLDRTREEIDAAVSAHGIELVVPADGPAVRLLSLLQPLRARSYPVPDHRTFDRLNDKWRFSELCRSIDVRHPPPRLYTDRHDLHQDLVSGALRLPVVVKPTNMSGSRGVHLIRSVEDAALVNQLAYSPVLAQPHIEGSDISLSAFARAGKVAASVVYRRQRGNCIFTANAELSALVGRILEHVEYDGVANFDARLDRSGRIHVLECNPRFWFTMDLALLAGMNFVAVAANPSRASSRSVMGAVLRSNRRLLVALRRPWTLTNHDLRSLWFRLRDPIPPLDDVLCRLRRRLRGDDSLTW